MTLIQIRYYFKLVSQGLGFVICCYFLWYSNQYEVSWGLLKNILPTAFVNYINSGLQITGTYIVLIPLVIIILSWLHHENKVLQILSSGLGLSATLFIIVSGLYKNTLATTYDMKVFLITKILTLEEKQVIFKAECTRLIAELYSKNDELCKKLHEHLTEQYFITYNVKLIELKEINAIKIYAQETITRIADFIINSQRISFDYQNIITTKYLMWFGSIIGIIIIGCAVWRFCGDGEALIIATQFGKKTAEKAAEQNDIITKSMITTNDLVNLLQGDYMYLVSRPAELVGKAAKEAFQKCQDRIDQLEKHVHNLAQIVKDLKTQLSNVSTTGKT